MEFFCINGFLLLLLVVVSSKAQYMDYGDYKTATESSEDSAILKKSISPIDSVSSENFITTCFKENSRSTCRQKYIKIGRVYYSCQPIHTFNAESMYMDMDQNSLYVYINNKAYVIENNTLKPTDKIPVPSSSIRDSMENIYYTREGKVFVIPNDTITTVYEIPSDDEYTFKLIALNSNLSELLILPMRSDNNLYIVDVKDIFPNTDMHFTTNKIGDLSGNLTALGVDPNSQRIYLGAKENNVGKLLQLNPIVENPCEFEDKNRVRFRTMVYNMTDRLINIFDTSVRDAESFSGFYSTELLKYKLEMDTLLIANMNLENKLKKLTKKFSSITDKFLIMENKLSYDGYGFESCSSKLSAVQNMAKDLKNSIFMSN